MWQFNDGKIQKNLAYSRGLIWERSLYQIPDTRATPNATKEPRPFNLGAVLPPCRAHRILKTKVFSFIKYMIHPID
jgi:hypothetical protein